MSDAEAVERIAHTAASPEGENSAYVLPDRGLVVDPGPPGDASWNALTTGLSAAGLPVESVETVVVTHWHADHAGLAPRLAAAAEARLALHESDAPLVAEYSAERERRLDRDARRLREWGVPERVVAALRDADEPSPMPDECPVTTLADGDTVGGVEAVYTPGHTAGHVAFDAGDALFLGDAVLPTYTPNVGGSDTRTDDPLSTYLDTLDRLRSYATGSGDGGASGYRAFPGHGATVDLGARIDAIRDHHADRVREMVRALPESGAGRTPWAVAEDAFGEMSGVHAKMGAGEAAAHLSFAAERGLAARVGGDPDRYVATDADPADPLSDRR